MALSAAWWLVVPVGAAGWHLVPLGASWCQLRTHLSKHSFLSGGGKFGDVMEGLYQFINSEVKYVAVKILKKDMPTERVCLLTSFPYPRLGRCAFTCLLTSFPYPRLGRCSFICLLTSFPYPRLGRCAFICLLASFPYRGRMLVNI